MECLHSIGEDLSGRFDILTILQGLAPSTPLKTAIHCIFVCSPYITGWFTILPTLPYMYYFSSLSLIPAPKDWVCEVSLSEEYGKVYRTLGEWGRRKRRNKEKKQTTRKPQH